MERKKEPADRNAEFGSHLGRLGAALERRRQALQLSREAVSEQAELSADGLFRIERGTSAPTVVTLAKIARALGQHPAVYLDAFVGEARQGGEHGLYELLDGQPADVVDAAKVCVAQLIRVASKRSFDP